MSETNGHTFIEKKKLGKRARNINPILLRAKAKMKYGKDTTNILLAKLKEKGIECSEPRLSNAFTIDPLTGKSKALYILAMVNDILKNDNGKINSNKQ